MSSRPALTAAQRLRRSQRAVATADTGPGRACVPLLTRQGHRTLHAGSGVLLELNGQLLILTAGHVAEGRQLYVHGSNGLHPFTGVAYGTTALSAGMSDTTDFAVLHCSDRFATTFSAQYRLTLAQLDIEESADAGSGRQYLIQGFPLSRSRVTAKSASYTGVVVTSVAADAATYARLGRYDFIHTVLSYDPEDATNVEGLSPPSLKGVSGGPIWSFGDAFDETGESARLVALAIEWHRRERAVVGVRIGLCMEFLRHHVPILLEGVPKATRFVFTKT